MANLGLNMNDKELCPICGEGHVTDHVEQVESEYKGTTALLPMHYQVCDTCHSDFAGSKEGKLNKRAIMAFRKSVDGLLTGNEISALREKYRLTQTQAAKLFGGGPVAFSKYENDDVSQSEAMDSLLRLVRRSEVAFVELVDEKGMTAELAYLKKLEAIEKTSTVTVKAANVVSMASFRGDSVRTYARATFTTELSEAKQ
jgi:HTH-type transcriptional regulator / antitoxin MqsA